MNALAHIPYGCWWSTPFARWQGSLSDLHSLKLAAHVARDALAARGIDAGLVDYAVLGTTVPQKGSFYGLPWVMAMLGAEGVAGPTIAQACATGARILASSCDEIGRGDASVALAIAADRVSNGPQLYYPAPSGPGGAGEPENWVLDNFGKDPHAGVPMVRTAENVAAEVGISLEEQHEVALCRYEQYQAALADDHAFQRRFMILPFDVPDPRFRKVVHRMTGDEGIHPTTAEGLARLRPVLDGGTVTYGAQTHPADGNAGMVVTSAERVGDLTRDKGISVRILSFGQARERVAFMPAAPIPAARRALAAAGLEIADIDAIKTHNPFAVNDIAFARAFGIDTGRMNNYGCSLVWGHPQGPTGLRSVIELIEELALRGGGTGLFVGCAAGDSAMAVVLHVGDPA
ncbi:thiolase family protein [Seohaeicola nanhaiensis]|uniref:Thiolase family protein n=1 Tax=Seohaeicola nanhaiensis TaxID=1387282 RepID=A0ABV9KDT6_9RHOB